MGLQGKATVISGGSAWGTLRRSKPRRAVIVCHSAGQRHTDQAQAAWWPVPRALAATGRFMCLAGDFGDPTVDLGPVSSRYSWGNDNAIESVSRAYDWLQSPSSGAKQGKVLLAATSMGAVLALNWALNWAIRYRSAVAAVILGCPVLDLEDVYANDKGGLGPSIAAAYGVIYPRSLPEIQTHSPARYPADLAGIPIKIYASSDDPIASDTPFCNTWAKAVGSGGLVSVFDLGAVQHWPVSTPVKDALEFSRIFA